MTLPPLPGAAYPVGTGSSFLDYYTRQQMRDYATAAVEAYKASLKPVAYMNPEWVKGELWPDDCFTLPEQSLPEDWVPLYRLDNSQKDDQP